jgi:protein-disulfide isomerase
VSSRLDKSVSAMLGISALAIAASVVWNTFLRKPMAPLRENVGARTAVEPKEWSEAIRLGLRIYGDSAAPVTVVEFIDLECPPCRAFNNVLHAFIAESRPAEVQVLLVHFPLAMHRFAKPAARALECAYHGGSAESFASTVFSHQDSLGFITWGELAHRAGIRDTARIERCAKDATPVPRIEESVALGERIGVQGTPTVFINGVRYGVPSREQLDSTVSVMREKASSASR